MEEPWPDWRSYGQQMEISVPLKHIQSGPRNEQLDLRYVANIAIFQESRKPVPEFELLELKLD